jgi:hypothetical protein
MNLTIRAERSSETPYVQHLTDKPNYKSVKSQINVQAKIYRLLNYYTHTHTHTHTHIYIYIYIYIYNSELQYQVLVGNIFLTIIYNKKKT